MVVRQIKNKYGRQAWCRWGLQILHVVASIATVRAKKYNMKKNDEDFEFSESIKDIVRGLVGLFIIVPNPKIKGEEEKINKIALKLLKQKLEKDGVNLGLFKK